jgi:hypothetical protein
LLYGDYLATGKRDIASGTGALRAFGDHKGSGLALICEVLGGALSGTGCTSPGRRIANGMFSLYIDPVRVDPQGMFPDDVVRFIEFVKQAKPAPPATETLVPGEPERIAAIVGVAPFNNDSGKYRGRRSITGGRRQLRNVLYMAALVATQHNSTIRTFYQRLITAGKLPKVAIVACMRKLIHIIYACCVTGKPFDPDYQRKKAEMASRKSNEMQPLAKIIASTPIPPSRSGSPVSESWPPVLKSKVNLLEISRRLVESEDVEKVMHVAAEVKNIKKLLLIAGVALRIENSDPVLQAATKCLATEAQGRPC